MPQAKRSRRVDKRALITASAEKLFTRHGAKRVTIEEICRSAGVSKMTFYKHFRNKVDLVQQIHDEIVNRGFEVFDEINSRDIPFTEKIELMGRWKQEFMSRLNVGFFAELIDVEHSVAEYKRRYLGNIKAAQAAGDVRADIDGELLWLVLDRVGDIFRDDSWRSVSSDLGEVQRQLRTLIWQGLLVREPILGDGERIRK